MRIFSLPRCQVSYYEVFLVLGELLETSRSGEALEHRNMPSLAGISTFGPVFLSVNLGPSEEKEN